VSAAGWSRVADDVRRFDRDAPGDAIDVVDDEITRQLRADTGGDGGLSRGRSLGRATTQVTKGKGEAEVVAAGSMRVWGIIEGGTSAHTMTAPQGHPLRTPYGPRYRARIGGSAARHTFTESCRRGLDRAADELTDAWVGLG
jgi:hypothetical protein